MLYLYTRHRFGCASTNKAERWLKMHNMTYQVISPSTITKQHIKQMLKLSNCTNDILLSRSSGQSTWEKLSLTENEIEEMSLNSFVNLLVQYPLLLRNLILFNRNKILVGYHEEKIRTFLSSEYRQIVRHKSF